MRIKRTFSVLLISLLLLSVCQITNAATSSTNGNEYITYLKKNLHKNNKLLRKYKKIRLVNLKSTSSKIQKLKIKRLKIKNSKIQKQLISTIKKYRKIRTIKHKIYTQKIIYYSKNVNDLKKRIKNYSLSSYEVGVYMDSPYTDIPNLEAKLSQKLGTFLWYQSMDVNFDIDLAKWLWGRGTKIQIAFEPRDIAKGVNEQPAYNLKSITNGDHDSKIYRWAQQIKEFGQPVYFRAMSEMNGDWVPWGGTANGNEPQDYIPAWRHIHNIFKEVGATNALFVWSPNNDSDQATALDTFLNYYPGDAYVDYIGINGYNWGTMYNTSAWQSSWQSFDQVFGPSYNVFSGATNKPIMIPEMASTSVGGDKATWIKESFTTIKEMYPRIKAVTWFNVNKETDWRFSEDPETLAAFNTYAF